MPSTPPPPSGVRPRRLRLIGLGLGGLVGLATTGIVLAAGLASGIASGGSIALLLGPDGLFAPDRGAPFVLAVPPVAAGLAGAIVAPWAARRARWAGMTMGYLTYLIGIVIGPLFVLVLPSVGAATVGSSAVSIVDGLLSVVFGVGVLWFVGGVILAPLLAACVLAGIAWAAVLRRVLGGQGTGLRAVPGAPASTAAAPLVDGPLIAMAVVAGVLGVLWLLLTAFLQLLSDARLG